MCPSAGGGAPVPAVRRRRNSPARKRRIAPQLVCTGKRLPRKGLPPSHGAALTRLAYPGNRLPLNGLRCCAVYPMKLSIRSAALCSVCSARCAACFALRRIDGLSIAPAATIETTAPAIAPVAMPEIKGDTRIKVLPPFINFDKNSMPARPSNFTKQKNVCLAQSTIYNSPVILYNYHNNPPLRCGL